MKERTKMLIALVLAFVSGAALYHYYAHLSQPYMLSERFVQLLDNPIDLKDLNKEPVTLPKLFLVGDSISKGYLPPLQRMLNGRVNVMRIDDNAKDTNYTLGNLRKWLDNVPRPDFILFNNGLHDMKFIDHRGETTDPATGRPNVSIEDYRNNLEQIVTLLIETEAKLVFATTTPVPEQAYGYIAGREIEYNQAAIEIMNRYGVLVCDLHTLATPFLPIIQNSRDIHFNPIGTWVLAEGIAAVILSQI